MRPRKRLGYRTPEECSLGIQAMVHFRLDVRQRPIRVVDARLSSPLLVIEPRLILLPVRLNDFSSAVCTERLRAWNGLHVRRVLRIGDHVAPVPAGSLKIRSNRCDVAVGELQNGEDYAGRQILRLVGEEYLETIAVLGCEVARDDPSDIGLRDIRYSLPHAPPPKGSAFSGWQ